MRIVFFEFVMHFGGSQRCLVELAARLSKHVSVSVVDAYGCCGPFVEAVREAGLDYHILCPEDGLRYVGGQGKPLLRAWRVMVSAPNLRKVQARVADLILRLGATVMCTNGFKGGGILGTSWRLRRVPLVVHLHGWYTPDMFRWYARLLARRRCAGLLAVSYATRAAVICAGVDPRKVHVLHNPIDVEAMLARASEPLESPLPQADRLVRICVPGLVVRTKGQHTAVQALRHILDSGHDAVLWIVGDCPEATREQREYPGQLRELAERQGVSERVAMLGGRNDLPQIMKASTLVAFPTHTEGHPRALLEAMSLGKPVAATPVGGVLDMVLQGVTGLYFEIEDAPGLAACVDQIVKDRAAAERMGREAQEYVRRNFQPAEQTAKALSIFRLIAGHG